MPIGRRHRSSGSPPQNRPGRRFRPAPSRRSARARRTCSVDRTVRDHLVAHFGARPRAIAEIPYDAHLAEGGPIQWTELTPSTRNAWTLAGATIVEALAEQDDRHLALRRA